MPELPGDLLGAVAGGDRLAGSGVAEGMEVRHRAALDGQPSPPLVDGLKAGNVGLPSSVRAAAIARRSSRSTFRCPSARPERVANTNAPSWECGLRALSASSMTASERGSSTVRRLSSVFSGWRLPWRSAW